MCGVSFVGGSQSSLLVLLVAGQGSDDESDDRATDAWQDQPMHALSATSHSPTFMVIDVSALPLSA